MLVIGGMTSLWGAVVGALAVSGLDSLLAEAENGLDIGRLHDRPARRHAARRRRRADGARADPPAERASPAAASCRSTALRRRRPPTPKENRHRENLHRRLRSSRLAVRGEPRHPRRRRGVGVRPLPGPRRRDQRATGCGSRERATSTRGCRRRATRRQLPPCDFGIVATKAMHAESAIAATAHAFADGAVASVMNGVGNEETLARHVGRVIRGTTFPAGKLLEPGHVQWDVKGDTTFSPFEPAPASHGRGRSARRRVHARRHAGPGRRRRASGTVAQGDLQRLDEPDRRAHGPHARPRLRAPRPPRARLAASSTRARRSLQRRGSRSTPTPRS